MITLLCSVSALTYAALLNQSAREGKSVDDVAGALLADETGTAHCPECGGHLDAEGVCRESAKHGGGV
jgi:hypothetical protein